MTDVGPRETTLLPQDVRSALHVLETYAAASERGARELERQGEGMTPPAMAGRQYARDLREVANTLTRVTRSPETAPERERLAARLVEYAAFLGGNGSVRTPLLGAADYRAIARLLRASPQSNDVSEEAVLTELERHEPSNGELECVCGWTETLDVPPLNSFNRHVAQALLRGASRGLKGEMES